MAKKERGKTMNKTQKEAIFSLVGTLFGALLISYVFITLFVFKIWPLVFVAYLAGIVFVAWVIFGFVFLRRKQSPAEPDSDERDNIIKQKGIQVSIISIGFLLIIASVVPWLFVGLSGSIPVVFLPFINFGILLAALILCNVAILIQYGWGGKDGQE